MRLVPLALHLEPGPGPLRPQVQAALAAHGRPLRWAITAARSSGGRSELQIEAVLIAPEGGSAQP